MKFRFALPCISLPFLLFQCTAGTGETPGTKPQSVPQELLLIAEETKASQDRITSYRLKKSSNSTMLKAMLPDQTTGTKVDTVQLEMTMKANYKLVRRHWTIESKESGDRSELSMVGLVNDKYFYYYQGGQIKESRKVYEHTGPEEMARDLVNIMNVLWGTEPSKQGFTDVLGRPLLEAVQETLDNPGNVWTVDQVETSDGFLYRCIGHWDGNPENLTSSCNVYDIDPMRGFLIVRSEVRDKAGKIIMEETIEPQEVQGIWLAKNVKHRMHDNFVEFTLSDVEINPDIPDSFFDLKSQEFEEHDTMVRYSADRTLSTELVYIKGTWVPKDLILDSPQEE